MLVFPNCDIDVRHLLVGRRDTSMDGSFYRDSWACSQNLHRRGV